MSVSSVGDRSKKKKGVGAVASRRNAVKDATPNPRQQGRIKKVKEDDEGPAADNDEEDD